MSFKEAQDSWKSSRVQKMNPRIASGPGSQQAGGSSASNSGSGRVIGFGEVKRQSEVRRDRAQRQMAFGYAGRGLDDTRSGGFDSPGGADASFEYSPGGEGGGMLRRRR